MKTFSFLLIILLAFNMQGQNLVPNSGFEKFQESYKIRGPKQYVVDNWAITKGTPDFFVGKVKKSLFIGKQNPHSEKGFAGFVQYSIYSSPEGIGFWYNEVLSVKLLSPLLAGKTYDIEAYVSLAEGSDITFSGINLLLTDTLIKYHQMNYIAKHAINKTDTLISATLKQDDEAPILEEKRWVKVSCSYLAKGGEEFIYFGQYNSPPIYDSISRQNDFTSSLKKNGIVHMAYYFIDDIRLELSDQQLQSVESIFSVINNKDSSIWLGKTMTLESICFENNKSELLPSDYPQLDSLVGYLSEHAELCIDIEGNTDNSGDSSSNNELSIKRARAVGKYLESNNISGKRISYYGFGSTNPRTSNMTEQGRALNRRVDVRFYRCN
jgi:OOP family OmpA-OmpF porin